LSGISVNQNIALEKRKEQALELNISIDDKMTQETIEKEIVVKLENGMKDLKNILNQIDLID